MPPTSDEDDLMLPICLRGDVCAKCGKAEGEHVAFRSAIKQWCDAKREALYRPHVHTIECSAEFWRAFGCEVEWTRLRWTRLRRLFCDPPDHVGDHSSGGFLSDILGTPASDEAWLAMRVILRAGKSRGWAYEITHDRAGIAYVGWWGASDATLGQVPSDGIDDLPRAVALAWWRAHIEEGAS